MQAELGKDGSLGAEGTANTDNSLHSLRNAFAALSTSDACASTGERAGEGDEAQDAEASPRSPSHADHAEGSTGEPEWTLAGAYRRSICFEKPAFPFDYYAVVDFECTCDRQKLYGHEIIEFPVVFVSAKTLEPEFEFHSYVKPTRRPTLTQFCTDLTGIEQATVDAAARLGTVLVEFDAFLRSRNLVWRRGDRAEGHPLFVICTDGPWDVRDFLGPETAEKRIGLPQYWRRWVDVRRAFTSHTGRGRRDVEGMLESLGMSFRGRPHSGIDDSRNIARILASLLRSGLKPEPGSR